MKPFFCFFLKLYNIIQILCILRQNKVRRKENRSRNKVEIVNEDTLFRHHSEWRHNVQTSTCQLRWSIISCISHYILHFCVFPSQTNYFHVLSAFRMSSKSLTYIICVILKKGDRSNSLFHYLKPNVHLNHFLPSIINFLESNFNCQTGDQIFRDSSYLGFELKKKWF